MKRIKYLIPIFFLILFAAAIMGINPVLAASPEEDFEFDGAGTITGYTGPGGDVEIPSSIGGVDVTAIGEDAFLDCFSLSSIILPDGITSLGGCAFCNCNSLTEINLPDSITSLGVNAFYNCNSLTEINLPDSITSIGEGAFYSCSILSAISIPDGVTSLNDGVFAYCSSLMTISLPNSITSIGDSTFYYCTSLLSITIPDSVTSMGNDVFRDCSNLIYVKLPDGITNISDFSFRSCYNLDTIDIPGSVTSIGESAFGKCESLTSITIPDGATSIGNDAFDGCSSLESIIIPDSVTSIGGGAFCDCTSLTNITIPSGITSIRDGLFFECDSLTSITIPGNVNIIGVDAFGKCESLSSVTISDGVSYILSGAFERCISMTSITLPDSVASIGVNAFYRCSNLTKAKFRGNAPEMSELVFDRCSADFKVGYLYGNDTFELTDGKWEGYDVVPLFTVNYHHNGGESGNVPLDENLYEIGETVSVRANTGALAKAGYNFAGWNTAADGSGTGYEENDTFTIAETEHITLYAQWTIRLPDAPELQTAVAGDKQVELTWSPVEDSTAYKVYVSTTSGSYGSPANTVAEAVYNCNVTSLTNGTTYYFVVTASNQGGDSPYSNELSATPKTVPGAPTNVTAAAGNKKATVQFTPPADNGGSSITEYTVTSSPGNITKTGTGTTITVSGLTNGTTYTFTVTATNSAGTGLPSAASNAVTPRSSTSGSSNNSSTSKTTPEEKTEDTKKTAKAEIFINGKTQTYAVITTKQEDNKTVTTAVLDDKKLGKQLESEGSNAVITILFYDDVDTAIGTLSGQSIKGMGDTESVLKIKTNHTTYTLPAQHIDIDAISKLIGEQVELEDIKVNIEISKPDSDTVKIIQDTADKNDYQIIVEPVTFQITCTYGDKTVEVANFNAYTERMIAIPEGIDPSSITTAVILNSDGTFSHVPTVITMIDGKYYAKINSLTNSTYFVIGNQKRFKDIETHWAKDALNDMGSRLIVSGVRDDVFEPDIDITRAEFTAIVVRALGLMHVGSGKDIFSDVTAEDWYYNAVSVAQEYGIISGYDSGGFGPADRITREQAMTIIARAMEITGLKIDLSYEETDQILKAFNDSSMLADYATQGSAACIKAGIVKGRNNQLLAPKNNITRAEAAVLIRRLLQASQLI